MDTQRSGSHLVNTLTMYGYWIVDRRDARLLETLHTIFCLHFVYVYTVNGFSNPQIIANIVW